MSAAIDLRNRAALMRRLTETTFDVLVIGAGITGAGIARDAAMRGLTVALVEARDFASGTSSRSTKLVHGGLRYLAQGEVNLVREASTERQIVRRIAPHLAVTRPVVVPAESRMGVATYRAGLWMYERLGGVKSSEQHEYWNRRKLEQQVPLLRSEGYVGAIVYPEYLTDDARLTVANVRSAAAHGAVVANYCAVDGIASQSNQDKHARITDALSGASEHVKARCIVNATGPWADQIRRLEDAQVEKRLQITKGIHLVLSRARVPLQQVLFVPNPDKRSLFFVPRGEFVYVGTTDTFYPEAEHWPTVTEDDINYVFAAMRRTLNIKDLDIGDVVSSWCGIRPLLGEAGKAPSELSRKDETMIGKQGVITIAGGKLTAYRRMAERVVDLCETQLGMKRSRSTTMNETLPGGDDADITALTKQVKARGHDDATAERIARLYGSEWQNVGASEQPLVAAEVEQAVLLEGAVQLEDWWVRRSARMWFGGQEADLRIAAVRMAELCQWSDEETAQQIDSCRELQHTADVGSRMQG